jgi:hypothetical protein
MCEKYVSFVQKHMDIENQPISSLIPECFTYPNEMHFYCADLGPSKHEAGGLHVTKELTLH